MAPAGGDIHTAGVSLLDGFHSPLGYNQYPKSEFKTDEFLPRGKIFSVVPRGVFYESKKAAYVDKNSELPPLRRP